MVFDHQNQNPNQTITILDRKGAIPEGEICYNWSGYQDSSMGHSLLGLLEDHSEDLRSRFFIVRTQLLKCLSVNYNSLLNPSEVEKQLFWMSLLVESSTFKSPCLLDILRLLALEQELNTKNTKEIRYIGPKKSVAESLRKLSQRQNISFYWEKTPTQPIGSLSRRLWYLLPNPLRSFSHLIKYVFQRWSLKASKVPIWFEGSKAIFIFSYFAHLDKDSCESGKFYSRQWEVLPELFRSIGMSINWAHMFQFSKTVPDTRTGICWLKSFNQNSSAQGLHSFLDTFLDFKVFLKCIYDWARINFIFLRWGKKFESPLAILQYGWLWPVLKKDWRDSMTGVTAMNNILWIHLFDRLMSTVPRQEQGFYLSENQGWERSFVNAWRKHGHGKIIGVAHSTVSYWDLRYFDESLAKNFPDLPRPDALAVNGPAAWLNLQKTGHPMQICVQIEALRYLYLNELVHNSEKKVTPQVEKQYLLILGDIKKETTHRLMLLLEHVYEKIAINYEIWIKPHPNNQIELGKYPKLKAKCTDLTLLELFQLTHVALTTVFTSAALDAFCCGIPVINYLDPDDFNLSNLRGIECTKFVSTENELFQALEQIEFSDHKKGKPEDFFWLEPELPKWRELLKEKIISQLENDQSGLNTAEYESVSS